MSLDGIWAALPTPFRADGALDPSGIAANARHCRDALGLEGVFCHGLMGEGWSLTLPERQAALEALLEGAAAALKVGVVVNHHALAETIALARHAAAAGAHHLVLMRPAGLFGPEEHLAYARAVSDAAAIPAVLFDGEAAGWTPATIATLAREGRLIGVKCTRDLDAGIALRAAVGDLVTVCDPYEGHALVNGLRFGARTLYADPEPYLFQTAARRRIAAMMAAVARGEAEVASREFAALEPLRRVYDTWILAPLRAGRAPCAALKHWCGRIGMAAGPVRAPLRNLTPEEAHALDAALDAAFACEADA